MSKDYIEAKNKIVLALDVDTKEEAISFIKELKDYVGIFKIGLQLFTSEGPEIVKTIQGEGCKIFFDGKFHDIPNTVAKASSNITRMGIDIFNVHLSGGSKMLQASVEASTKLSMSSGVEPPIILGVSALSSIDQQTLNDELCVSININDYVINLCKLAKSSGLNGVIASVKEVAQIKQTLGKDFLVMCPGIRPAWSAVNDQKRIATPAEAIKLGADYIVVGRPITSASDRKSAAKRIIDEVGEVGDRKKPVTA